MKEFRGVLFLFLLSPFAGGGEGKESSGLSDIFVSGRAVCTGTEEREGADEGRP